MRGCKVFLLTQTNTNGVDSRMKVWTNTEFDGFWPVGTAAVVVADTVEQAAELLNMALVKRGLAPTAAADVFELVSVESPAAIVLRDGDY